MEDDPLSQIIKLIAIKTGLRLDGHDGKSLRQVAAGRMTLHGFSRPEQYCELLESETGKGNLEREELISLLTVGESFFFRDKGQFHLLRNVLLPELIERRKTERVLNIWSAGCATGEEPYSIAIILHEMLPDIAEWRLSLVGTDIKDEFLERARKAVYRDWSFRMVPEEIRKKYFEEKNGSFVLSPVIKDMVTFRRGNLLNGEFPVPGGMSNDIDIILCRNVFIYYKRSTAAAIVKKMAKALRIGGYLITGHWELFSSPTGMLEPRMFASSLAYRRVREGAVKELFSELPSMPPAKEIPYTDVTAPISYGSPLPAPRENHVQALPPPNLVKEIKKDPGDFHSLCLSARSYADNGDHARAVECLQKAIAIDPLSAEPYYLLSHITEENGDVASAKEYLKKVIYLEPSSVNGHLDLAAMYDGGGEIEKARKMRIAALDALKRLPQQSIVEPYGKTAAEFASLIEQLLT